MERVRILGLSGSPRHGNTEILVNEALEAAAKLGDVDVEFTSLADKKIKGGCEACYVCFTQPLAEPLCTVYEDDLNEILKKITTLNSWCVLFF